MVTSEKLMLHFFCLPFLQASLVTVIHRVSSVVDSVEKEGILLLLHCWLRVSVLLFGGWLLAVQNAIFFTHTSSKETERLKKMNHIWKISIKCLISQSGASFD